LGVRLIGWLAVNSFMFLVFCPADAPCHSLDYHFRHQKW
jgi:hypothetical protein